MGSSPLRAKQALFDDWGLSEEEDTKPSFFALLLAENVKREDADIKPRLDTAEVEHRRKSRAFAVAAKERKLRKAERKELKRRRQEEEEKERERERERERQKEREEELRTQRQEEERKQRQQKRPARREIIDLTGPTVTPIPPPQIPPPPRRAQSAVEFVRKSATLRRTSSNPLPSASSDRTGQTGRAGQASKKRKTEISSSGSTSTKREIFTDLSFYYLPDSALGARKLRIAKAQQHGATWVRNPEEATHVIVDKPFTWAEIESAIEARRPDAIVVYDEYPLDCIGFQCLLNPSQRRYQIKGRDEADTAEKTEKAEAKEKTQPTNEFYTIKPARRLAGSSSRSREREQMIRRPRQG